MKKTTVGTIVIAGMLAAMPAPAGAQQPRTPERPAAGQVPAKPTPPAAPSRPSAAHAMTQGFNVVLVLGDLANGPHLPDDLPLGAGHIGEYESMGGQPGDPAGHRHDGERRRGDHHQVRGAEPFRAKPGATIVHRAPGLRPPDRGLPAGESDQATGDAAAPQGQPEGAADQAQADDGHLVKQRTLHPFHMPPGESLVTRCSFLAPRKNPKGSDPFRFPVELTQVRGLTPKAPGRPPWRPA